MADITTLKNYKLKIIFIIHFTLISLSSLAHWTPSAYLFYNSILILCLLWSLHSHESEEPVQIAFVVNAVSIVLDALLLLMNFSNQSVADSFSGAMAIIHMLSRLGTTYVLGRLIQERLGSFDPLSSAGNLFSGGRSSYEDIDKSTPPIHSTHGGYDFSSAQPL